MSSKTFIVRSKATPTETRIKNFLICKKLNSNFPTSHARQSRVGGDDTTTIHGRTNQQRGGGQQALTFMRQVKGCLRKSTRKRIFSLRPCDSVWGCRAVDTSQIRRSKQCYYSFSSFPASEYDCAQATRLIRAYTKTTA